VELPDLISFLEYPRIGQEVIVGLHLVTGHLKLLTGIMMGVMQPIHKVCHVVDCRLLLVGGDPNNRSQGKCSSLLNTMLASIMPVVS
jgi:hypothetical protein